jgi:hypothetical protein
MIFPEYHTQTILEHNHTQHGEIADLSTCSNIDMMIIGDVVI